MGLLRAIVLAVLMGGSIASAADTVQLTVHPGHPLGGISQDAAQVKVTRPISGTYREVEIDRYFTAVSEVLKKIGPGEFCVEFAIDSPILVIEINLNGVSRTLRCTLGTGTRGYGGQRERAFNQIVILTLEQAQHTLGAK